MGEIIYNYFWSPGNTIVPGRLLFLREKKKLKKTHWILFTVLSNLMHFPEAYVFSISILEYEFQDHIETELRSMLASKFLETGTKCFQDFFTRTVNCTKVTSFHSIRQRLQDPHCHLSNGKGCYCHTVSSLRTGIRNRHQLQLPGLIPVNWSLSSWQ